MNRVCRVLAGLGPSGRGAPTSLAAPITFPLKSKLAGRVEGRSKQARLGLTAHITAPIIHAGFSGKITLEIVNHGPFELKVRPEEHPGLQQLLGNHGRSNWTPSSRTVKRLLLKTIHAASICSSKCPEQ
jgi:hypothetical protein